MASQCQIRICATDRKAARKLAQPAIDEIRRIETSYSRYRADSVVSRINAAAGKHRVACDEETSALFGYADTLFKASDGLFDITSGVLRRAWDFRVARLPAPETLDVLCALIGWGQVQRDSLGVFLPKAGMEIDFGGFGKEYAADRAAAILADRGAQFGYVNLGGDMRFIGPRPDGRPWIIGIQDPRRKNGVIASIPVSCGSLTTSGDYERFFELDGRRYCHLLDPISGWPVRHWRSVSVVAPLAVASGSYSSIAMLKQSEGLNFLDGANMAYLAVDNRGNMFRRDLSSQ
ncbi:MAG: FAD:protein FMN transferase [Betaproteobacteria bacterium]|nr:FAD:protein FMN transferase [Betaproteobacteria bacterium]